MTRPVRDWDAVVVGAGPAGSVTALELARVGASVLLVDRRPFPRWKVCGACLSPGTLSALRAVGVGEALDALGAAPLHTLRLAGWGTEAEVPLGSSAALSRSALDAALVAAARKAGASWLAPARARLGPPGDGFRWVELHPGAVAPHPHRARVVVAADGVESGILGTALGDRRRDPTGDGSRIGLGALFPPASGGYPAGIIHMAVGPGGYVGVVRLEDGALDVGAALDAAPLREGLRPEARVARILEEAGFPPLPAEPMAGWRGTPHLTHTPAARGAERVLAVGDAAGYVEPFTGEGIGWAVSGARLLAPLVAEGIGSWHPGLVPTWDTTWERSVGAAARLCRGMSWALRRPALARAGLLALRSAPFLAAPFVRRAGNAPQGHPGAAGDAA